MNVDIRLFRRSTLLALHPDDPTWKEVIDGLEVVDIETGPDGRFQFVPAGANIPLMLPSCSFFNRSVDEPWFIFTPGMADDGAVYIGRSDFHALAETAGYQPISQAERVNEENQRLRHELDLATTLVNDLRNAVASLVGVQATLLEPATEDDKRNVDKPVKSRRSENASRGDIDLAEELSLGDDLSGIEN